MRRISQRLASFEQNARQPRFVIEADVKSIIGTRERTEGAAAAVQAKHGDSCSAKRSAIPCSRGDALEGNGAAVPKSCISPLEMCTSTATSGLLPASTTSTATRTAFDQPRRRFCPIEDTSFERTSVQYASYYSSFWWINDKLAAPSWRRVIQTKSRQTLVFSQGGSTGRLRACPSI